MAEPASSPPQRPATRRLFLALWPDEAQRRQLAAYFPLLQGCGGRKVARDNLHLTLAFLGSVDTPTQTCLERQLDTLQSAPFTLQLDRLGYWRRPQVVWLGAEALPPELVELVAALKKVMLGCGLEPETRPFQAHLTLMRKARRAPLKSVPPPILWAIDGFALVASETLPEGAKYTVLRRWVVKGDRGQKSRCEV